jgi:condensin-2 complex subunit H2
VAAAAAAAEDEEDDDNDYFGGGDGGEGVDFGVYGEGGGADYDEDDDNGGDGLFNGGFGANPNIAGQLSPLSRKHNGNDDEEDESGEGGFALALDAAFTAAPKSYAELCKQHIASFMRGVDRYAHESQLSKRVGEWQEKLGPVLEEQNKRREFDIHEYGHEILRAMDEAKGEIVQRNRRQSKAAAAGGSSKLLGAAAASAVELEDENRIPFVEATQAKPSYEAARLFLAMLQLTNNGNVALYHPDECTVCGPNDLTVEVLSTALAQERFDNYLAPSLVGGGGKGGK